MQKVYNEIIDDFGLGYVKFGHSELMGRVVGYLLCTVSPVSVDDISEALEVTRTPVNQICRRLEDLNLVRRVRKSGERKYYYQVSADVFLQAGINLSRLYEDSLQVAENHLTPLLSRYKKATGEEKKRIKIVCERLIRMREFHIRQVQAYQKFIGEWRATKNALPTVEEYAAKINSEAA